MNPTMPLWGRVCLLTLLTAASAPAAGSEKTPVDALRLSLALRAVHRTLGFRDMPAAVSPSSPQPLSFELPLGAAPFAEVELYPLDLLADDGPLDVALVAGYERLLGTRTVALGGTAAQTTLDTSSSQAYAGLRGRLLLGSHELGLSGAYGEHAFAVSALTLGSQRGTLVPDVSYTFFRLGLDTRLRFGAVSLGAGLATRFVHSAGALETDWFPGTRTRVIEGNLFVGYRLFAALDAVVGLDYLRYTSSFQTGASNGAHGTSSAVDQYLSAWFGLEVHAAAGSL